MVEYSLRLDSVFGSLADPTRRDILQLVAKQELSVGDIASHYDLSFASISKHLKVLEKANLIIKRRQGKRHYVKLAPAAFKGAEEYLRQYGVILEKQLDSLEQYLMEENDGKN